MAADVVGGKPSRHKWYPFQMPSRREAIVLGAGALGAAACRRVLPSFSAAEGAKLGRTEREVTQIVDAQPTIEGAGVHLRRSLGSRALPLLDPFLMLDEFHSDRPEDYEPGFPSHPHRGFETVTYMLAGAVEHRDSLGNHGHLGPGCAQWMTAGPRHHPLGDAACTIRGNPLMWGFQLWINLPAANKMTKPRYQDIAPAHIPEVEVDDGVVRLVAGEVAGKTGPVDGIVTAPQMMDVTPRQARFRAPRRARGPQRLRLRFRGRGAARPGACPRRRWPARGPGRRRRVARTR